MINRYFQEKEWVFLFCIILFLNNTDIKVHHDHGVVENMLLEKCIHTDIHTGTARTLQLTYFLFRMRF